MKKPFIVLFLFAMFFLFGCDPDLMSTKYTITFNTNGGNIVDAITQRFATEIKAPENPTKEGYTFVEWDQEIPERMPKEDLLINAIWEINQYTIRFNTDGGSMIDPITQAFDTLVVAPLNPTKENYSFISWDRLMPSKMPSEDIILTAIWEAYNYIISFNTDGGSIIDPIIQAFDIEVEAPNNPTKEGYTFISWDREIPDKMPSEDLTINAIWEINQYTISFNTNGGSIIDPITQNFDTLVVAPNNPTKENHTFKCWDKDIPSKMPSEDLTINAIWEINQYTLSFNTEGGSIIDDIVLAYDSKIPLITNPTKEGYTFISWDQEIPDKMPSEDLTLSAIWEINQYTLSFNTNGGSTIDSIIQDFDTLVVAPINPTKEGHTFMGWDKVIPDKMPSEDLTINAIWKINQYTISFNSNGGSYIEPITQDYDTIVVAPDNPVKALFTFMGWDKEIPTKMPGEDIELNAIWGQDKFFYFGKYPQTVVLDEDLIAVLDTLTTTNANGYYELGSHEYAKATASPFAYAAQFFINGPSIIRGKVYYFKVEPIKWRILVNDDGTLTLLTDMIIDFKLFFPDISTNRIINDELIYPNNYEHSTIRAWLNSEFYNKTFSENEKESIQTTFVDNSASTTSSMENPHICADTYDKVYLLSYQDITTDIYGLNSDKERKATPTYYARALGSNAYYTYSYWHLRSPNPNYTSSATNVNENGTVVSVGVNYGSARPTIRIKITP